MSKTGGVAAPGPVFLRLLRLAMLNFSRVGLEKLLLIIIHRLCRSNVMRCHDYLVKNLSKCLCAYSVLTYYSCYINS